MTDAERLQTLLKRSGVTPEWECRHGMPFTRACQLCKAGAVWSKAETKRMGITEKDK